MTAICPECHSTIAPGYRGACVTCLRRELADHHTLHLTPEEARHLLAVLRANRETGDYHGPDRAAWWARHEELTDRLAAVQQAHAPGGRAIDACRLLTQWATDRTNLPDGLDVIIGAAWDAVLAGGPRYYHPAAIDKAAPPG